MSSDLTDQPNTRLMNLYGKRFGTTSLTMWDQTNRSVSFLVRVSLDTRDLETRIRQTFRVPRSRYARWARRSFWMARSPTRRPCRSPSARNHDADVQSWIHGRRSRRGRRMTRGASMSGGGGMGGGWRRRLAEAGWAGGGGAAGGPRPPGHHQSRDRTGPAPGHASREDRRNQPQRDPRCRRELALRPGKFDLRFSCWQQRGLSTSTNAAYNQGTGSRGFVTPAIGTFSGTARPRGP